MPSNKKTLHIEAIRMLAILCVMFIHSGYRGHQAFAAGTTPVTFVFSLFLSCLTDIGVTLFWMVSGALLLGRGEDAVTTYKKRLPRILILLLFFSLIRYFYNYFVEQSGRLDVLDFIRGILSGNIFLPYWFLYFYIGVILALPFLSMIVRGMSLRDWNLFVILEFFFLVVVRILELSLETIVSVPFYVPEAINALFFGYFAERIVPEKMLKKPWAAAAFFATAMILVLLECIMTVKLGSVSGPEQKVFNKFFLELIALSVYLFIKSIACHFEHLSSNGLVSRFLIYGGSCSFGLYLIEDYVRNALVFIDDVLAVRITTLPACVVWILVCYFVGLVIVGFIKKIPVLGKLI